MKASSVDPRKLTERHKQLIGLISRASSNKDMARELGLSIKTIEKHRAELMRRGNFKNGADVTRFAYENGLAGDGVACPACGHRLDVPA